MKELSIRDFGFKHLKKYVRSYDTVIAHISLCKSVNIKYKCALCGLEFGGI